MAFKKYTFQTWENVTTVLAVDTDWKDGELTLESFCKELNEYFIYGESYLQKANGDHVTAALIRIAEHVPAVKLGEGLNDYGVATCFHEQLGAEAYPNLDGSRGIWLLSCSADEDFFSVDDFDCSEEIDAEELTASIPQGNM